MDSRKDQLVDEEIMETASVAPPEPEEHQQQQGESSKDHEGATDGHPPERPSPG